MKGLAKRAEYIEKYKADIADAETRKADAQRLLAETDVDGPRQSVASYEKEATAARDAAVAKADVDAAAQREAALNDETPAAMAKAAVALCVVADNVEALLEAVHENLPSDTIEDADVLSLGAAAASCLPHRWRRAVRRRRDARTPSPRRAVRRSRRSRGAQRRPGR